MPDGDQYNGKLKYRHIQSYKMLCEDKFADRRDTEKDIGKYKKIYSEYG